MNSTPTLALYYIRNGQETIFPVKNVQHAIVLADAIADSDLLNEDIDFNVIGLAEYNPETKETGYDYFDEEGREFREIWDEWRELNGLY